MAISSQHLALLQAHESASQVEIWRGPARGVLDETAIVAGWLPTTGAGWSDQSAAVPLDAGVEIAHDGRGATIRFAVAAESRLDWADDLAVAVVSRHWDGAAWTARALDAWGYLDGSGRQRLGQGLDQTGERVATYHGYWARTNLPPHRIGRRNLAQGATVAASTPALASVTAEAGLEYISQDSNAPQKAIDGNADTVYIADLVADPAQPALGDATEPRILRAYAGRTVRSIGAGNEPIWIEIWCGHNLTPWGTTWVGIPGMYAEGTPAIRNDGQMQTSVVTYGDGSKGFRVLLKQQPGNPNAEGFVQWGVGGGGKRPVRIAFEIAAGDGPSVGKLLNGWFTAGSERHDLNPIVLPATFASYSFDFATNGDGAAYFNLKALKNQLNAAAITYDLKNLRISVGYHDDSSANGRLFVSYDNGAGVGRTQRLAWDLAGADLAIPADGSIIVADDIATFRAKFDPGNRLVVQFRNLQPEWFFGPGIGKVALRQGFDPNRMVYNPPGGPGGAVTTLDEIDFTANGLTWAPTQGLSRQSPIGTGALAAEDYPHVGLLPGAYGGGYLWLDLGAYQPTVLSLAMTSGQTTMTVEDGDRLTVGGEAVIGAERVLVGARTDNTFAITRAQGGTTAAAHAEGDSVTPRVGGATQTGPQWDGIEIRRRPGKPPLRSGVVLTSNLTSPGDPSVGGAKWERHPDWTLLARFDNAAGADTIALRPPGGVIQARHVCVGDVLMHRRDGIPQRFKVNEVAVDEWVPGGNAAGKWAGHAAGNLAEVAAHFLTQHGGVPAAKVAVAASPAPIRDLPVAGATLGQALGNLETDGGLRVWLDPYNVATIAPDPANPQYDAREAYVTLDGSVLIGEVAGAWGVRSPVSQVKGTFTETASLRTHLIAYPDAPGALGRVVEIRGAVRSWAEGRARVERAYRSLSARRTPQERRIGPAPWVRPWLRVVDNPSGLDAGGQWSGVNCAIVGYRVGFREGPAGGAICETDLTLQEIVL